MQYFDFTSHSPLYDVNSVKAYNHNPRSLRELKPGDLVMIYIESEEDPNIIEIFSIRPLLKVRRNRVSCEFGNKVSHFDRDSGQELRLWGGKEKNHPFYIGVPSDDVRTELAKCVGLEDNHFFQS